ncbi:MAG: hypothetical protein Q4B01_07975 [Eubacteriales bacterium]|nr:hypothetical protein [Eubacteriales bacterium]
MIYEVIKIEEDIDFGCEERSDDQPLLAVVTLKNSAGETIVRKFPDRELENEQIQSKDRVIIDENGKLCKALEEDWTKNCTPKTVDVQKFVSMMEAVKAGQEIDWKCPFCGEEVKRLEQEDGHTVIGCTSCDMRINLENH